MSARACVAHTKNAVVVVVAVAEALLHPLMHPLYRITLHGPGPYPARVKHSVLVDLARMSSRVTDQMVGINVR